MSCTQLVTPNLDPVIYQSGHMLTDWWGWCLLVTQTMYGSGWAGSNAWQGWTEHVSMKHEDRNIPGGMYVPIWFSGYGGLGHVAIYKDGQVWSSPWHHKPNADVLNSIDEVERIYGVHYVGWSEDIGGTQVVEYHPDVTPEPVVPQPTYQIVETYPDGKQIQLNKQPTNLWGMNYVAPGALPPVEVHDKAEIWTVTNKVHHQNGYDYYRREGQIDGFNILDCDDYTLPVPYVPPAAPITAPPSQKYTVKATIMYFSTVQDAQFKSNALGTIKPGKYYIFNLADKAVQLGDDNQHPLYWINSKDNVAPASVVKVEPTPEPVPVKLKPSQVKPGTQADNIWKATYKPIYPDGHSDLYESKQYFTMLDYSGKKNPVPVQPGNRFRVTGTFLKDGVMFYRTRSSHDEFFTWYYGISLYDDNGAIKLLKVVDTTPKPTLKNILYWVTDDLRRWWDIKTKKENK